MSKPICVVVAFDLTQIPFAPLKSLYDVYAFEDLQSTINFISSHQERTRMIISGKNYFRDPSSKCNLVRNIVYELLEYLRETSYYTASCTVVICSSDLRKEPNTPAIQFIGEAMHENESRNGSSTMQHELLMLGVTYISYFTKGAVDFARNFFPSATSILNEEAVSKQMRKNCWKLFKTHWNEEGGSYGPYQQATPQKLVKEPTKLNQILRQVTVMSSDARHRIVPDQVYEYSNSYLNACYLLRRCKMVNITREEGWMFHGTSVNNYQTIFTHGFVMPIQSTSLVDTSSFNLSPCSSGVLLSCHASKTLEYITHGNKIIMCRGSSGNSKVEKSSQSIKDQVRPNDVLPQFDSLYLDPYSDSSANDLITHYDDEYMIFHPAQFVPKYEIVFTDEQLKLCSSCRHKLGHKEE